MKLKTLSPRICQELLDGGYTYFKVKFNAEGEEFGNSDKLVTYIPVKEQSQDDIAIDQVRERIGSMRGQYFVMVKE